MQDPALNMVGAMLFKNKHKKFIFDLSNPPVHTLWKSDTPISPKNAHYMKKY